MRLAELVFDGMTPEEAAAEDLVERHRTQPGRIDVDADRSGSAQVDDVMNMARPEGDGAPLGQGGAVRVDAAARQLGDGCLCELARRHHDRAG